LTLIFEQSIEGGAPDQMLVLMMIPYVSNSGQVGYSIY